MATIVTYRAFVQNEVQDFSARAQSIIDRALSDAYQEILSYTAKWLVGTSEETQTGSTSVRYVTPTAFMQITDVQWKDAGDTDYRQLNPIEEREYLQKHVNADTGRPNFWYVKGSKIYFERIPDTAGTAFITYIPVQDELTGDEVSLLPDRFTQVIVLGAIARYKAYLGLSDAREYDRLFRGPYGTQGRIEGALGRMIQEISTNQRSKKISFWNR